MFSGTERRFSVKATDRQKERGALSSFCQTSIPANFMMADSCFSIWAISSIEVWASAEEFWTLPRKKR
jgi:hypothetical protein